MTFAASRIAVTLAITTWFTLTAPAGAQWLKYKTPGIPRTADGKPNLAAPAPRTPDGKPDLTGIWRTDTAGDAQTGKALGSLKAQPWAEAIAKKRKEELGRDAPSIACLPRGPLGMDPGKIIQTPGMIVILFEDLSYRQIFMDGRALPEIVQPDWMGYSVGHWEKDTLVVETAGFNDRSWLDGDGHPHSEALRVTERFRRTAFGHMEVQRTFQDLQALTEPWTVPSKLEFDADTEPLEYVCAENEKDRQHLVGKASDEKGVTVAAQILAKYVGAYQMKIPETGQIIDFAFSLSEGKLTISGGGGPTTALTPLSETEFSGPFGNIRFVMDDKGVFSTVILQIVEGDFKGTRKSTGAK